MTDYVCVNASLTPCTNYGQPVIPDDPDSPYSPVCPVCGCLAGEMESTEPGGVHL